MKHTDTRTRVSSSEGECPYCQNRDNHEHSHNIAMECSFYTVWVCLSCLHNFADPYLLVYDEYRDEETEQYIGDL